MHRLIVLTLASAALALAACSDYGSGGESITPPVQPGAQNPGLASSSAARPTGATPTPSAPPGNTATYALADAPNGLRCPQVDGYSCILHLNVPASTPAPQPRPHGARVTPSPTPTATPTPTPSPASSGSPKPTPSPSATPAVTLQLEANPHDVPAMANPSAHAVVTTALIALRASVNQDTSLHGGASIAFILPDGQLGGRSFALQLFQETTQRHNRHSDAFIGSYSKSTIDGTTLNFAIAPPQFTIKQGETWLLVLYASDIPSASASPQASASPSTGPSPTPSPTASP